MANTKATAAKGKGKAAAAPAPEPTELAIAVGSWVRFLGYDENTPEEEKILEEGGEYEVVELPGIEAVDGKDVETGYVIRVSNPDFNSKKKVHPDTNPEFLETEVFEEEIELVSDDEGGEVASGEGEGEDEGGEGEEEGVVDYAYLTTLTKEELLELAAAESVKLTAAQKKTDKTLVAALAKAWELEPEAPAVIEQAPAKGKGKAAAKEPAPAPKGKGKAAEAKPATKGKAATKPAAAETDPVDPDAVPDLEGEDEAVLALIEGADDLVAVAQELESNVAVSEYQLGGVLYHIKKEKLHLATDKKGKLLDPEYGEAGGFKKFLMDHFNVEYRKAAYLIDIYINFTQAGIENPSEVIGTLGWTKASKISKYLILENADADALLEAASKNTVADLSTILKEQFDLDGGGEGSSGAKGTRITLRYRYVESEANAFEDALKSLADQWGIKPEDALFQIVIDAHAREVAGGGAEEEEEETPPETAPRGRGKATAATTASAKPAGRGKARA